MSVLCEPAELITKSIMGSHKWALGKELGEGAYGTVSEVCCESDCTHVAKHIPVRPTRSSTKEQIITKIKQEVELQRKAAAAGLAPKVIEAWFCQNFDSATIIMQRADMTLDSMLCDIKSLSEFKTLMNVCFGLVESLHKIGIYHNDLNPENIMWSKQDNKFYFIDFGLATKDKPLEEDDEIRDDLPELFKDVRRTLVRKCGMDKKKLKEYLKIMANIEPLMCA
jgi:tRNA A-37 threonylcarbamoyl transferase component Bud32